MTAYSHHPSSPIIAHQSPIITHHHPSSTIITHHRTCAFRNPTRRQISSPGPLVTAIASTSLTLVKPACTQSQPVNGSEGRVRVGEGE